MKDFSQSPARDAIGRLFWPETVALVGVSRKGGMVTDILHSLRKWGFNGKLVAVNPRYEEFDGVPCFPSLSAVPAPVGLAVIGIPKGAIPDVLADAEAARVGAIQIVSSGFAEGAKNIEDQLRLSNWSARTGIPVAGPNCSGLVNAANGLVAITSPFETMRAGGVSAVLQSGMVSTGLLMGLLARGIGIGRAIASGNEACADIADYIGWLAEDELTRVIACYSEQIKRPLEFIKACERAADHGKPIVMIKVGRSDGARHAAMAHTGSLVGADVAIDAVLKKLGVVRVDTIDDLIESAAALSSPKRPRGRRVAFASISGGANSILLDLAESSSLEFPQLPADLATHLDQIVPEFGNVGNPLDLTGQSYYEPRIVDESLCALATSGAYDVVVWGNTLASPIDMNSAIGKGLTRAAAAAPDVVFPVLSAVGVHFFGASSAAGDEGRNAVEFDGMPFLQGMGPGLKALSALIGYAEFLRERKSARRLSAHWGHRSAKYAQALDLLRDAKNAVLTEREGKRLLALYGIPVTREALAINAVEAARVAQELGFPVVMKIESAEIVHKTDVGGVVLNIATPEEAAQAFEKIMASVRAHEPEAQIAGVVVQEMAKPGAEMMLGASFDAQFGPVIALGLGGIWVEALKDVRTMLPPFDVQDVQAEIAKLRAVNVLRGARGGAAADLQAFAECVVAFATLCSDLAGEIQEIDINPVILAAGDQGIKAVDCLITRKAARAGPRTKPEVAASVLPN
jgi:acetyltransferase